MNVYSKFRLLARGRLHSTPYVGVENRIQITSFSGTLCNRSVYRSLRSVECLLQIKDGGVQWPLLLSVLLI